MRRVVFLVFTFMFVQLLSQNQDNSLTVRAQDSSVLSYYITNENWMEEYILLKEKHPLECYNMEVGSGVHGLSSDKERSQQGSEKVKEILASTPITLDHYDLVNIIACIIKMAEINISSGTGGAFANSMAEMFLELTGPSRVIRAYEAGFQDPSNGFAFKNSVLDCVEDILSEYNKPDFLTSLSELEETDARLNERINKIIADCQPDE